MKIQEDCKRLLQHLPRKIIHELYCKEPNPQYTTLLIFLEVNYPEYNNEEDASFIWDNAHVTKQQLANILNL